MLNITDLKFRIGPVQILHGITFSISKGERVGLIGPNGSGKTTLFNCISGFNRPTNGTVIFQNSEITHSPAHIRAKIGIGRVFQNFGIFKEMTLLENILVALEGQANAPFSIFKANKGLLERAEACLTEIGLTDKAKEKAGSLSGGQMRLLEIGRAVASGAELLLLDEPTAGVSPKMKEEVERMLQRLHEFGKTTLVIEHDIHFIGRIADRIIVLDGGRVVLDNTPERVRGDSRLQEIYFGSSSHSTSTGIRPEDIV